MADEQRPDYGSYDGTLGTEQTGYTSSHNDALGRSVEDFSRRTNSMLGQGLGYPSVYDRLPGGLLYLGNSIANSTKFNFNLDDDFGKFSSGKSAKDIADEEELTRAQEEMQRLASQGATLDTSQADSFMQQYMGEANRQIPVPQKPELQNPSLAAGIMSLLGGFIDRNNAFAYGAAPFAEGLRQQDEGYKSNVQAYQQALQDHQARLAGYRDSADMANRNALARFQGDESTIGRQFQAASQKFAQAGQRAMSNDKAQQAMEKLLQQQDFKQQQDTLNSAWKAYTGAGDLAQRRQAWQLLRTQPGLEMLAEPTQQYSKELESLSKTGLNWTRANQIETLLPYRTAIMVSQYGLNEARAQKLAKETVWMDELNAAKVAEASQRIQNMQSLIQSRADMNSYRWTKLAQEGWAKSQTSINTGLRSLSTQINTINSNRRALEKEFYGTNWLRDEKGNVTGAQAKRYNELASQLGAYDDQIKDLQSQYQSLKSEADDVRVTLRDTGVNLDGKPSGEAAGGGTSWITPPNAAKYSAQRWNDFGVPKDHLDSDRQNGRSSDYRALGNFAKHFGFDVTSGFATSGHNENSPHYRGLAVDVRTRNKSDEQIQAFIDAANANGIRVLDERKRLPGEKVWSGPHLHIEFLNRAPVPKAQKPKQADSSQGKSWWQRSTGGGGSGGAVVGRRSGATITPIK